MVPIDPNTAILYGIVSLIAFGVFWIAYSPDKVWRYRKIPGPIGLPVVGNLPEVLKHGLPGLCHIYSKKYGPVFKLWFGRVPLVVISDADGARKMCFQNMARPNTDHQHAFKGIDMEYVNSGLIPSRGALWRTLRKIYEAATLRPVSLAGYVPLMDDCAIKMIDIMDPEVEKGKPINIWKEIGHMTLAVVGKTAYGVDFHTLDKDSQDANSQGARLMRGCQGIFFWNIVSNVSKYVFALVLFPPFDSFIRELAYMFPDVSFKSLQEARNTVFSVSSVLLKEARDTLAKRITSGIATENDRTSSLLFKLAEGAGTDKEDGKLNDMQVKANANVFMLAAYETTQNAIGFTIYLLCINPDKMQKLVEEVDNANLPPLDGRTLTAEDLERLPYTDAVFKEALRCYPSVPFVFRENEKKIVIAGVEIEPGMGTQMDTFTLHNNPKYWPQADKFLPERWLPEGKELEMNHPGAYMPFGMGPRQCVGYKYAAQEAKVTLARLFQKYTFTLDPPSQHPLKTKTGITSMPRDGAIMVKVHRRTKA